jgi:hypothetical protein
MSELASESWALRFGRMPATSASEELGMSELASESWAQRLGRMPATSAGEELA